MPPRQIKMPVKDGSEQEVEEVLSQRKRPERGRFLLQVDRQTKGSYTTSEAAKAAALVIKKKYPIVQVSVYDSADNPDKLVERRPPDRTKSCNIAASILAKLAAVHASRLVAIACAVERVLGVPREILGVPPMCGG